MKKKLCSIICLCSFVSVMLFACGKNTNLIEMSTAENDCKTQIGNLNGETDDRICEYKDYPTDEWNIKNEE